MKAADLKLTAIIPTILREGSITLNPDGSERDFDMGSMALLQFSGYERLSDALLELGNKLELVDNTNLFVRLVWDGRATFVVGVCLPTCSTEVQDAISAARLDTEDGCYLDNLTALKLGMMSDEELVRWAQERAA